MPAGPALGSASVEIAEGKGNRRGTEGEPNRTATAEGTEPENAGRRETEEGGRRGRNRLGKRETGGKPGREPEDVRWGPKPPGESPGIWGRTYISVLLAGRRELRLAGSRGLPRWG